MRVYKNIDEEIEIFNRDERIVLTKQEARQLIADIMVALDETAKPDVTTQAYQEFDKRPSEAAVDALWSEKETPFTTEQKMQAVIRKTRDLSENQEFTVGEFQDSGDLPQLTVYDMRPSIREQHATYTAERMSFENDLQRFVSLYDEVKKRGWLK